jgi:hypothetical protein
MEPAGRASMPSKKKSAKPSKKPTTRVVSDDIFKQVYDSPQSLPGKHRWVTSDADVRALEKLLGMKPKTIGAPLWVSGDTRECRKCGRETSWLDIVASGLGRQHSAEMIAKVILGSAKFVNVEAPRAIAELVCFKCKSPSTDLRSFKCHNWAYARPELLEVLEQMAQRAR